MYCVVPSNLRVVLVWDDACLLIDYYYFVQVVLAVVCELWPCCQLREDERRGGRFW